MTTRFALVVEGEADYAAIPVLLSNAGASAIAVIKIGGQAVEANLQTLVDRCLLKYTWIAILKKPDKVVVVLDREGRLDCPGQIAWAVQTELTSQLSARFRYSGSPLISVVCADRALENWLVADPSGVAKHAYFSKSFQSKVGNNADSKDAEAMIKAAYRRGTQYHSRRDAPRLAAKVRTSDVAVRKRSKSLDKLLREFGV